MTARRRLVDVQHLESVRRHAGYRFRGDALPPFRLVTDDETQVTATMTDHDRSELDIADMPPLFFREDSQQEYIWVAVARLYKRSQVVTFKRPVSRFQELRNL